MLSLASLLTFFFNFCHGQTKFLRHKDNLCNIAFFSLFLSSSVASALRWAVKKDYTINLIEGDSQNKNV